MKKYNISHDVCYNFLIMKMLQLYEHVYMRPKAN